MKDKPIFYKECIFYPFANIPGIGNEPFRYDTEVFLDKFCLPTTDQADDLIASSTNEFKVLLLSILDFIKTSPEGRMIPEIPLFAL